MAQISVPDVNYAAIYYADFLEQLRNFHRRTQQKISDENIHEPYIHLERAFALVGHHNAVLADIIAGESMFSTLALRESLKSHLKLIGESLQEAYPSTAELIGKLTQEFLNGEKLIDALSQFSTKESDPIIFESQAASYLGADTDGLSHVFGWNGTVFTPNHAAEAKTPGGTPFNLWPGTPAANWAIYLGHKDLMWNRLDIALASLASGIFGVWEYADDELEDDAPDDLTVNPGNLTFELTSLLGSLDRSGAWVRITYLPSGVYDEAFSTFVGGKNVVTTSGFLGQVTPSTALSDYAVGVEWNPIDVTENEVFDFTADGKIVFDLPKTVYKNWTKKTIDNVEAFWLRYRIVSAAAPVSPTFNQIKFTQGDRFPVWQVVQGRTISRVIGRSNGLPSQVFTLADTPYIQDSLTIKVAGQDYVEVDDFLLSQSISRHFTVNVNVDGQVKITFGDGENGKIPPLAEDINATYRIGAGRDGNVGANTVTANLSGASYLLDITNPRTAAGWIQKEGYDDADIARLKIEKPKGLRVSDTAAGPSDAEILVVNDYQSLGGSKPVIRAKAIEEGRGPKTILLLVCGAGGAYLSTDVLTDIYNWFNGIGGYKKRIIANHWLYVENYLGRNVPVTGTIETPSGTTLDTRDALKESVTNAIINFLSPVRLLSDGVNWQWSWGDKIALSQIITEMTDVNQSLVRKCTLTLPAGDTVLAPKELPRTDSSIINLAVV